MTSDDNANRTGADAGEKVRKVLGIALLMLISYEIGLGHGRSEKIAGQYTALKAQYDRIESQYSGLKADYDRADTEYSLMKNKCEATAAQYTALKTQYDQLGRRKPAQP